MKMIDTLINDMKLFAKDDFHVQTVSSYLSNLNLTMDDLKKFNHRMQHNYTRNLIHREPNFEIMLVCWPPHISAPIHGHEGEKCWARVQTGKLNICNYKEVSRDPLKLEKIQELECAPGFLDGPADIHSVENLSDEFATSLHVYAKPYDACEIFNLEKGIIQRAKMDYHSMDGTLCNR
jgi:predicted metal-dependent enzyme (double-stranded beta helix superfamily)